MGPEWGVVGDGERFAVSLSFDDQCGGCFGAEGGRERGASEREIGEGGCASAGAGREKGVVEWLRRRRWEKRELKVEINRNHRVDLGNSETRVRNLTHEQDETSTSSGSACLEMGERTGRRGSRAKLFRG